MIIISAIGRARRAHVLALFALLMIAEFRPKALAEQKLQDVLSAATEFEIMAAASMVALSLFALAFGACFGACALVMLALSLKA